MSTADKLPTRTLVALTLYRLKRTRPGQFLTYCLENNFVQAVCLADDDNFKAIRAIARYIYNEMPGKCWGSPEKVNAWVERRENEH